MTISPDYIRNGVIETRQIKIDPEFEALIPPLTQEELDGLEQSILNEGCRDALVVWHDTLIDGHNRYKICKKHNLPYSVTEKEFDSRDAVILWMIDNQLARRNISVADRIILAQKKKPLLRTMAKQNVADGQAKRNNALANESNLEQMFQITSTHESKFSPEDFFDLDDELPEQKQSSEPAPKVKQPVHVRDEIAKIAGTSTMTVTRFEKVQKEKPELIEEIRKNNMSINQAYNQVKRAEKEAKREEQRQENAEKIEELATPLEAQGLFQTIVIDPPWDWGDEGDINQFGRAKPDYHTMPIEDIKALPVGNIADENCHLYLWVTNRSLPKAFDLINAWGFRYITCLTWVKPSFGMGNYFRGDTEQVLFAVKGSQPLKRKDVGTHFEAPRGKGHSAKPDEFYALVESCSYGPYIDIFGRKDREGWSVWGENG